MSQSANVSQQGPYVAVVVMVAYFRQALLALHDIPAIAPPEWHPMRKIYASFIMST